MTSTCPACSKSVDPLRSRFVRVVGGKVVAYCSAACAGVPVADPPRPAAPVTPAPARAATPAAGVPARASTPAAGVPVRPATPPSAALGPPVPATPPRGVPLGPDSGPVIEILHEPASGVVTSARDARDEAAEPRARHPDEIPIAAFWSADKERSGAVRAAGEPGTGPVPRAPEAPEGQGRGGDDTLDRWTADSGDRNPTDRAGSEGTAVVATASRLRVLLIVLVLIVAGGVLVYQFLLKNGLAAATHAVSSAAAAGAPAVPARLEPPAAPAPAAPAIDAGAAVAQARAVLQAGLAATSPRMQRLAAAALARTQDRAALELLAAQLGGRDPASRDGGDIARLEIAYALARGGYRRGTDALVAALASPRTEARDQAACLLALLGDARAVRRLVAVLAVSQRRLGAAEHLAHLAEPRAIEVLQQIRGDAQASADHRARATIALGTAGDAAVAPALRDLLGDPHFNAFAAGALAGLGDPAARPVLERQLDSPSLSVRAARGLRRLDPALDPSALLPHLLGVLRAGRDRDQVQAAEAILVLAGPAAWSAHE